MRSCEPVARDVETPVLRVGGVRARRPAFEIAVLDCASRRRASGTAVARYFGGDRQVRHFTKTGCASARRKTWESFPPHAGPMASWSGWGFMSRQPEEFADVARDFDLHELAVEDTVNAHQRPKLERYGDHLVLGVAAGALHR
jgi:hypothetical protein